MNKKAVIFDLDGTLTEHNSWFEFTKFFGASVDDHIKIYKDALAGKISLEESKQKLIKMWQQSENANEKSINDLFASWSVKHDALRVVEWLQNSGFRVGIITGSMKQYVKYVAKALSLDDYYSSAELMYDENGLLIDFDYSINQSAVKLVQLEQFCRRYGLGMSDCIVVGDGDNDIDIFKETNRGIFIEGEMSSESLRKVAWKSVAQLSEIIEIIKSE